MVGRHSAQKCFWATVRWNWRRWLDTPALTL